MIIEAKPLSRRNFKRLYWFLTALFRIKFNRVIINECEIRQEGSYLILCNHFSFWDGFWLAFMIYKVIRKRDLMRTVYTMTLRKQMENYQWLRFLGCFSIDPGKNTVLESIQYASKILETPGNILILFPQGKLESSHIRTIEMEKGLSYLMKRTKANYQIIWCSNFTEYFESINPTLYMNLLNLGEGNELNFEDLKPRIDDFHLRSMNSLIRNKI